MSVFGVYSRYYNLLYGDKDYPGEAAYVHELIQRYRPGAGNILDLGCGTGRHDLLLAEAGYAVTGVDQSAEMLAVAQAHVADPLAVETTPIFHQGDIRTIRLHRRFEAVVSLFHVMNYLTENDDLRAAFATAKAHLVDGGLFVFDSWYGPAVLTERPAIRVKRLEDEAITVTRIVEPVMQAMANRVDLHYQVLVKDKRAGTVEELREIHHMRYLFHPEIESLLEEAGMRLVKAMEWMTGRQPGFDTWGVCFVAKTI